MQRRTIEELRFCASAPLTLGVELELGIVDPDGFDLAPGAPILVASLARDGFGRQFKAEITSAMIEVNSSVHSNAVALQVDLERLVSTLVTYANRYGFRIIGGGTHPFQEWTDRKIYPEARFRRLSHEYGYLARQFTVFGQHVHVGCALGDDAVYLTHALAQYTPHLIALAAASPFWRGVDTGFECCRLNIVNAFPLSGRAPRVRSWEEFEHFYQQMRRRNVVDSMKDFYWDVRPKPEFGTVEVRVCDSPLRIVDAVDIATLVQALAASLLEAPRHWGDEYGECVYARNRFQAARYGLEGEFIDIDAVDKVTLRDSLRELLERLEDRFVALDAGSAYERLCDRVRSPAIGATWLRERYRAGKDLRGVVCDMSAALLAPA
jgi:glutamate---cysteine ligase / carboxylate-amine ligase